MHALYQLSDALRALSKIAFDDLETSNGDTSTDEIIDSPPVHKNSEPFVDELTERFNFQLDLAAPHLVRAAEICIDETEVQSNIIRILSVLSEQEPCCDAIAEMAARIGILLGPGPTSLQPVQAFAGAPTSNVHPIAAKSLGVLSRIGYILGNIMARSESARIQFYNNDVAMEYLLQNLEVYATVRFTLKVRSPKATGDECDTVIDVLIKLIRVVANMSVSPEVGFGLANCHPLGSVLLSLLLTINKIKINFVCGSISISPFALTWM